MGHMIDDDEITRRQFMGFDVHTICCGVLYQMCGAFDCLMYVMGRVRKDRDPEREKTLAYFLDVWTLVLLGGASMAGIFIMVFYKWQFSDLNDVGFADRYL